MCGEQVAWAQESHTLGCVFEGLSGSKLKFASVWHGKSGEVVEPVLPSGGRLKLGSLVKVEGGEILA